MAWTAPSTFVAGAILTAAQLNTNVRDNTLAGGPIYTTEALRDAAITSPFEGQRAYITGSTVAAATGGTTAVPTGIQTIYNGTGWVCVTPISAVTGNSGATALTAYSATLTGSPGTNPSVTLTTGTTALVWFSARLYNSSAATGNYVGVAVSGATTIAASDSSCIYIDAANANYNMTSTYQYAITGLTAGTNTLTLQYKVTSAAATISNRSLTAQGIA